MAVRRRGGAFVGGEWMGVPEIGEVRDRFSGNVISTIGKATRELTRCAVDSAYEAFETADFPPYRRYEGPVDRLKVTSGQEARVY